MGMTKSKGWVLSPGRECPRAVQRPGQPWQSLYQRSLDSPRLCLSSSSSVEEPGAFPVIPQLPAPSPSRVPDWASGCLWGRLGAQDTPDSQIVSHGLQLGWNSLGKGKIPGYELQRSSQVPHRSPPALPGNSLGGTWCRIPVL